VKFLRYFKREMRRTRSGEWRFVCRVCDYVGSYHYYFGEAALDRKLHRCVDAD